MMMIITAIVRINPTSIKEQLKWQPKVYSVYTMTLQKITQMFIYSKNSRILYARNLPVGDQFFLNPSFLILKCSLGMASSAVALQGAYACLGYVSSLCKGKICSYIYNSNIETISGLYMYIIRAIFAIQQTIVVIYRYVRSM